MIRQQDKIKFYKKINKHYGKDGCWNWNAAKDVDGYGRIYIGKKQMLAHRVSFLLNKGRIPKGECICHTCSNRACVNPKHLIANISPRGGKYN